MTSGNPSNGGLLAAVTLGSNSFNLLLASPSASGVPVVVAKHKRKVRLAEGLDADTGLSTEAFERGIDCLAWFGDILRQTRPQRVQVLATAALRVAANADHFRAQAEPLLGYPIEVISGDAEAELIYQGMRACTSVAGEALVIDIGGASTELVIGDAERIHFKHSFELGCVLYTQRYFSGAVTETGFEAAAGAVARLLTPQLPQIRQLQWQHCLGVSGTVRALFELAPQLGWQQPVLTLELLTLVKTRLCEDSDAVLALLDSERRPPFTAGVAILLSIFQLLNITELRQAGGALREGLLHRLQSGSY
ncbi:Ppx/GppA phosphatase [Ferrimonas sediminum]|uniref:Ppx/GppA phosphatase n=1 Tax=Ferrimonas sediminum TaxID=718193 RepID=A0A1G8K1J5_9GAMM|nr:hypothetical protein [Ferrimonas sediminum]SDI37294.1 Ppx/GppA phosphatase [Ferrimonas sediminum]